MKPIYFSLLLLVLFSACVKHYRTDGVQPIIAATCDTLKVVSYKNQVVPIFKSHCYSCHATDTVNKYGRNIDLENFTSLSSYLLLGYRGDGLLGSKLIHIIQHAQTVVPMPPGYDLDTCSQKLIVAWIHQGAQQN
jgi:hypothetical protein